MMKRVLFGVFVVVTMILVQTPAWAQIAPYSQNFEAMALADPNNLASDGWLAFMNAFDSSNNYLGGYPKPIVNGAGNIADVVSGEGGPAQGVQQLSVYSDYQNADQATGILIETNVFQERTIGAADVGTTFVFTFDAKRGNLGGISTALAFIKTLDPNNLWATTNFLTEPMTAIPTTWGTYSIQITIDAGLVNQVLQFGFQSFTTNYDPTGMFYDNINFEAPPIEPSMEFEKASTFDTSVHDNDNSGTITAGDSLLYTIVATNIGLGDATGVVINDTPDGNTTLMVGSVTTTQGTITSGNTAGDGSVSVDVGTIAPAGSVTVTFVVMIDNPVPAGVTEISNQAFLSGANVTTEISNTVIDTVGARQRAEAIPTLSTWSLVLFMMVLAGVAIRRLRF